MTFTASCEWISFVAGWTLADGVMANDLTSSVNATNVSSARVNAFVIVAGRSQTAVGADNAFRLTVWSNALISWLTRTNAMSVLFPFPTVWATRIRITWVSYDRY